MDYEDTNADFLKSNPSLQDLNAELLKRHTKIVAETTKRLFILVCLIVIFLLTFMPNFITTVLKNTLNTQEISLRPYSLIGSIINLSDSTLNAVILLYLCVRSNDTDFSMHSLESSPKSSFSNTFDTCVGLIKCRGGGLNASDLSAYSMENECRSATALDNNSNNNNESMPNKLLNSNNIPKTNTMNRANIKEFYSKIGNRLGNLD